MATSCSVLTFKRLSYPLLKASRNLRIEGLNYTGAILYHLKQEAQAKIVAIQNAKNLISELSAKRKGRIKTGVSDVDLD